MWTRPTKRVRNDPDRMASRVRRSHGQHLRLTISKNESSVVPSGIRRRRSFSYYCEPPPHPVRRSLFVRKQYSASMHRGLLYRLRGLVNKTRRRCDGRRPRGGTTGHAAPRRPTGEPWPDRKAGEEGKGWFMAKAGDSQNLQAERVVGSDYDVSETRLK